MMERVAERLAWAVETLELAPEDRVLEIGCGAGIAVSLVCERLAGGRVTALDRSEAMVRMARQRNRAHVDAGRAVILHGAFGGADLGGERFDRIFAVNVGLFRADAAGEAALLRTLLAPGGAVHLFHQPPVAARTRPWAEETSRVLRDHGFAVLDVRFAEMQPAPAACVIARPR